MDEKQKKRSPLVYKDHVLKVLRTSRGFSVHVLDSSQYSEPSFDMASKAMRVDVGVTRDLAYGSASAGHGASERILS